MVRERTSKVVSLSLPPEAAAEFDRIAAEEGRNRSELFREMIRVYETERRLRAFRKLQRSVAGEARRLGLRDEEGVVRLIHELRGVEYRGSSSTRTSSSRRSPIREERRIGRTSTP